MCPATFPDSHYGQRRNNRFAFTRTTTDMLNVLRYPTQTLPVDPEQNSSVAGPLPYFMPVKYGHSNSTGYHFYLGTKSQFYCGAQRFIRSASFLGAVVLYTDIHHLQS